jgi:hypothetical protein
VFNNRIYLFWKPVGTFGIYFSASADGATWPPGQLINETDTTPDAVAACVYFNQIYLFWRDSDSSQIVTSVSADGAVWSAGQTINTTDTTPSTLSTCVYQGVLLLFWKANDVSNALYYSWSTGVAPSGAISFAPGVVINRTDSTSQAPTGSISVNQNWVFLFWVANDPSNRLWFSAGNTSPAINAAGGFLPGPSLPGLGSNWPAGQLVDTIDSTPAPISAAVFNGGLFVFWRANDPSNRIWFSSASLDFQLTITDCATGGPIPNAVCENSTTGPFAYGPVGLSQSQPGGVGADNVYVMGVPQNTTMLWTAPGYSY